MNIDKILHAAIDHYGKDRQKLKLFEELAELQIEVLKQDDAEKLSQKSDLVSELVDVTIMSCQIMRMYNITNQEFENHLEFKLQRLADRIGFKEID